MRSRARGGLDTPEHHNQSLYSDGPLTQAFDALGRFLDRGEEAALGLVAPAARGRAILDIGFGAGRTTSLLRLLSEDYVGLDYSPSLVARARRAHPAADLSVGDARDLGRFSDCRFGLVLFSFNGLDSVGHADRERALSEFYRVLEPGGHLVISTLNKNSSWYGRMPWQRSRDPRTPAQRLESILRVSALFAMHPHVYAYRWRTGWRLRHRFEDHGDWAIGPLSGPGTGLIVHWTTLTGARREQQEAGFEPLAAFGLDGAELDSECRAEASGYVHFVAQKPLV